MVSCVLTHLGREEEKEREGEGERREGRERGRRERERREIIKSGNLLYFCYIQFSAEQELSLHTSPVTCVTGQHLLPRNTNEGESPPVRTLIASASGDSTLNIWKRRSVKGASLV